jgi:hypothetical protein
MPNTDPNADFAQFVREVVAEENAKNAPANTQVQPQPEPLTLTVAGQTFSYNNKAELEAAVNRFAVEASNKIGELSQQAHANQIAPNVNSVPDGSYVTGNEPVWKNEEFIEKMTKDPREGLRHWLNHEVFDGKSEDPAGDIKRALTETELTKRTIAAYQFKENHPEFPGGQQAAQVIEQIRTSMGLPYDYNGIEAAYLIGMQRGALPDYRTAYQAQQYQAQQTQAQAQSMQAGQGPSNSNPFVTQPGQMDPRQFNGGFGMINMNAQQQAYAQNPYLAAPPGVNRNYPSNYAPNIDPESLSIEQLEAIFEKSGQPIQRSR